MLDMYIHISDRVPDAFILNHSSLSTRSGAIDIIYRTFLSFSTSTSIANLLKAAISIIYRNRSRKPIKAPPLSVDYCIKHFYLAISATTLSSFFKIWKYVSSIVIVRNIVFECIVFQACKVVIFVKNDCD